MSFFSVRPFAYISDEFYNLGNMPDILLQHYSRSQFSISIR